MIIGYKVYTAVKMLTFPIILWGLFFIDKDALTLWLFTLALWWKHEVHFQEPLSKYSFRRNTEMKN